MRSIWKYQFEVSEHFQLSMPANAEVIHVDIQDYQPTIWAIVDTDASEESRCFHIFETGHRIPPKNLPSEYLKTFQQGPFVWHLFEETKDE